MVLVTTLMAPPALKVLFREKAQKAAKPAPSEML